MFIAALRSQRGAAYRLLLLLGDPKFDINISVPLVLEYEAVANRFLDELRLERTDVDKIIDYICKVAKQRKIFFLWRPYLKDPKDDMILELAVTAGCDFIITYNQSDFKGVETFNIRVLTAREFLELLGELP